MENKETNRKSSLQVVECKFVTVPPGTKSRGRLPRPGDPEPTLIGTYWPMGIVVFATLVIGIAIGRFLL